MSWVQKIREGITITTGDSRVYTPLYVITSKEIGYNIAEFEFPEIEGTLVKRSKAKGARYSIELIFQGDNHLDVSEQFEVSNRDSRPWSVSHPLYGNFFAQPVSLSFDSSGLNTTRITGEIIETITDDYPRTSIDPRDKLIQDLEIYKSTSIDAFSSNVDLKSEDINTIKNQSETIYNNGADAIKNGDQSNEYFGLFNEAIGNISFGISQVSTMITSVYNLIVYPYLFEDSVTNRLNVLLTQFNSLNESIPSIDSKSEKLTYELSGGALVSAQILTALNPLDGDYDNAVDVLSVIDVLLDSYNTYIENLDSFQSANGASVDSYIPSYEAVDDISNAIDLATSSLLSISLNARNERSFIVHKDTSPILLCHRFYGLDENDDSLELFIRQNNLSFNEHLIIKKGRKIIYYI